MKETVNNENSKKIKLSPSTIVGIVLCALLLPILIINCTLLIKGWVNKDEVPSIGGIFPMIVYTDSMHQVFESGDLIICKKADPEDVKSGDVISYFDPVSKNNSVVTHKVKFITTAEDGSLVFWTYGVANVDKEFEDITESDCDIIPEKYLIGIYSGTKLNGLGSVALFLQSTPGLIICIGIPLIGLVGYDLIRRKLYETQNASDKDELLKELEELRKLKQKQEETENTEE